jgi:hypothetical protein
MGYLRKILVNSEVRRSMKGLAFDIKALRINLKHNRWVISQIKKISALIASYNDLVIEKVRINDSSSDILLCFDQLQRAGINSIRNIWITTSDIYLPYDNFHQNNKRKLLVLPGVQVLVYPDPARLKSADSLKLPNLQVCHIINPTRDPELGFTTTEVYRGQWDGIKSIRRLHLICYTIDPENFFGMLNHMLHLKEVILIDVILCRDTDGYNNMTGLRQESMWLDFAKSFDRSQRRLLIGVTEGSVCHGSDVDYSIFTNVRKLSKDEVLDMMNCVDFEQ